MNRMEVQNGRKNAGFKRVKETKKGSVFRIKELHKKLKH